MTALCDSFELSPFPNRNHNPINPSISCPLLCNNQSVPTLCKYHINTDSFIYFDISPCMKTELKPDREFYRRGIMSMTYILLNSPWLSGIEKLPKLFQLLDLFELVLVLPETLTCPCVPPEMHGNFQVTFTTNNFLSFYLNTCIIDVLSMLLTNLAYH